MRSLLIRSLYLKLLSLASLTCCALSLALSLFSIFPPPIHLHLFHHFAPENNHQLKLEPGLQWGDYVWKICIKSGELCQPKLPQIYKAICKTFF